MTKPNPRIEIYSRDKGKKRWFKTGIVFKAIHEQAAKSKMVELYRLNKGRKQYMLKRCKI